MSGVTRARWLMPRQRGASGRSGSAMAISLSVSRVRDPAATVVPRRRLTPPRPRRHRMSDALVLHDPRTYTRGFPYEHFRELRASDPVSHHDHPAWDRGYWAVVRHADVQRVSRDSATFRNAPNPFLPDAEYGDDAGTSALLISLDAPEHVKLRKLINKGFTPRRVADLTDRIHKRVAGLVDALADRRACDLVEDLAPWLPLHVIADLVGVPEADRR